MMKRRDFLLLTGAAALGVITPSLHARPRDGYQLSVARELDGGEALFHDAEVRIDALRGPHDMHLDALFSVEGSDVRFHAASSGSVPVRFTMPIDPLHGLRFELRVSGTSKVIPVQLKVPVRSGHYVVALKDEAQMRFGPIHVVIESPHEIRALERPVDDKVVVGGADADPRSDSKLE